MIAETKNRLAQVVEINRALSQDLDVSRRQVAEISRDRDALRQKVETLEGQIQDAAFAPEPRSTRNEIESIREELTEAWRQTNMMMEEQTELMERAEHAQNRADQAEQQLHSMLVHLQRVEQERNQLSVSLEESQAAMMEIHTRLVQLPPNQIDFRSL